MQYSKYDIDFEKIKKIKRCTCCVLPETMPFIKFDDKGVCNYCRTYKKEIQREIEKAQDAITQINYLIDICNKYREK